MNSWSPGLCLNKSLNHVEPSVPPLAGSDLPPSRKDGSSTPTTLPTYRPTTFPALSLVFAQYENPSRTNQEPRYQCFASKNRLRALRKNHDYCAKPTEIFRSSYHPGIYLRAKRRAIPSCVAQYLSHPALLSRKPLSINRSHPPLIAHYIARKNLTHRCQGVIEVLHEA